MFKKKKKKVLQSNQNSINSEQFKSHDGGNIINIIDQDNHLTSVTEMNNLNVNLPPLNSLRTDNDINSKFKETLIANFLENIEHFPIMSLKGRPYYTKITRKPSENEIQIIDNIADE